MKNVQRPDIPESLRENGGKWTRALRKRIREKGNVKDVEDRYFEKYREDDVRKALENMYKGNCCFCETIIKPSGYERIEHRKPKRKYPESTYEWDNLHLCCEVCNTNKGTKFDDRDEILDAALDVPITEHFKYEIISELRELDWVHRTPKGKTTCKDVKINREPLGERRYDVATKIFELITGIKDSGNVRKVRKAKKLIRKLEAGEYGSVVLWLRRLYL